MFGNLKLNLAKEIGEICALIIAIVLAIVFKLGFWIGLLIFIGLELLYLVVYSVLEKRFAKPEPEKPKEEINFHEYDDEEENEEEI